MKPLKNIVISHTQKKKQSKFNNAVKAMRTKFGDGKDYFQQNCKIARNSNTTINEQDFEDIDVQELQLTQKFNSSKLNSYFMDSFEHEQNKQIKHCTSQEKLDLYIDDDNNDNEEYQEDFFQQLDQQLKQYQKNQLELKDYGIEGQSTQSICNAKLTIDQCFQLFDE